MGQTFSVCAYAMRRARDYAWAALVLALVVVAAVVAAAATAVVVAVLGQDLVEYRALKHTRLEAARSPTFFSSSATIAACSLST